MTIADDVLAQAAVQPDALAVACAGTALLYRDLDFLSAQLAGELNELGVGPDDVVGILIERSPAMIVAALAVLRAGGAYLPVDPSSPERWISTVLKGADISALIASPSGMRVAPETPCPRITVDPCGRRTAGGTPRTLEGSRPCAATPENLAYVIFTSGSTGSPKGVEGTHAGLSHLVQWHRENFMIAKADRATQIASVGFDGAVWEIWPYLASGASLHLPPGGLLAEPAALRDWLVAAQITIGFAPTPLAERLISLEWPREAKLRALLTGADTLHRYPPGGLPFALVNNYGPTECTVVATSCRVPPNPSSDGLPPIGRPISGTKAYILDEWLRPVDAGVPGELHLGGPGVARGYRNRPDLTRERFIRNPFSAAPAERIFKTGDLVRALPDGQIAFLGRLDEQLKIRGYRIEPQEIAATLNAHPAVAESTVVGREFDGGDKRLVAYFVPRAGARATPAEFQGFLAARLPAFMVPALFVVVEALPLTSSGKVDRSRLPAPNGRNVLQDESFTPPRTETERSVAAILAPLLGIARVDVKANFFALGGHSLLGTQLIVRLRNAFGIELPLRSVFEAPSVAELSDEIDRQLLTRLEAAGEDLTPSLLAPNP